MPRRGQAALASNRSTTRKIRRCKNGAGKDRHGSDRPLVFDKARSPGPRPGASRVLPAPERWRPFLFRVERRETFERREENRRRTRAARAELADRSSRAVLPRWRGRDHFAPSRKTQSPANAEYRTP